MSVKLILAALCALALAACSKTRSVVAMKLSEEEAHIALGENDIKVGDRVTLFGNEFERPAFRYAGIDKGPICDKVKAGGGTVTKILGPDYSAIRLDPGTVYEEGMTVEKL